jgi:hypothetical protein
MSKHSEEIDLVTLLKLVQIIRMLYGVEPGQVLFEKYFYDITGLTKDDLFNKLKATKKFNKE